MAKKSRRARKSSARPDTRVVIRVQPTEESQPTLHEYDYVVADLRRVAIVAAAMFALLIALSFFIG